MNIKPKVQIGDIVNIVGCGWIQTNYGWKTVHLTSRFNGKFNNYYVIDIRVELLLKSGEIKYVYLISSNQNGDSYSTGWVDDKHIELANKEIAC